MVEAGTAGIWWRKSSYSGGDNNCVEVGTTGAEVAVRDSKHPGGDALSFSAEAWKSLTERLYRPLMRNSNRQ
ncbi:MAG TPA: DUF397 domain-containing protein [Streptosporangiaceae bacterium]|jgi:hypothetical protein|nr:DUF397 domain-containing protein [Streptosporangiaceae bacterium]